MLKRSRTSYGDSLGVRSFVPLSVAVCSVYNDVSEKFSELDRDRNWFHVVTVDFG